MQSGAWIALLKRFPPAQHNVLTIKTLCGTEINIQNILRLDPEYTVIRGRLAATTETGRVYFIPYDQINYIGYTKEVKEGQIRELFGEPLLSDGQEEATAAESTENTDHEVPAQPEATDAAAEPHIPTPAKSETPAGDAAKPPERLSGKEAILQRLRARTLTTAKPKPEP